MERKRRAEDDADSSDSEAPRKPVSRTRKKAKVPDVAVLERKHGLTFKGDDLVVTREGVERGLYPEQALLDYEKKKEALRIEAAPKKNEEKTENTRVLPAKLKSVCAANLHQKKAPVSECENERNKDMIYRLMMDNTPAGLENLAKFSALAFQKLEEEKLRPRDREDDDAIWGASHALLETTTDPLLRRAFIWVALTVSSAFVDVFCPRRQGQYLTDADKLLYFLRDKESPYIDIFARMLVPSHDADEASYTRLFAAKFSPKFDLQCFTASATFEWVKMQPWEKMDMWAATNPAETSIELKLLLNPGGLSQDDRTLARTHFITERGESSMVQPLMIENGEDE